MTTETRKKPVEIARQVVEEVVAPLAPEIDSQKRFPEEAFKAFAQTGLLGLLVPEQFGGMGGTLVDLAEVLETIGQACGSTAMCYLMHNCGTMMIVSRATEYQQEHYLRPIARGEKIGTLAFSETGTGAHFYNPEIKSINDNGHYLLSGQKSFVTNGDKSDFMIVITNSAKGEGLDMLIVDTKSKGIQFSGEWMGLGLRGNNSISLTMDKVRVPASHLIGQEGEGMTLIFEVVAPTFIAGISGVNVGLARGAYQAALHHVKSRTYANGQSLAHVPAIQYYLADMYGQVEAASLFVKNAAKEMVEGKEGAILNILQSKIIASQSAQSVTTIAMQVCGGKGYTSALPVERFFRDARAGSVMAPTTDVLKEWVGKSVAGLPLF
jgi:alkylation response protein AidB-like acyl-CoA dehydrogenase